MTTFPSSSTPTRTGEVCSPPPDLRVMSTARWLLVTNARASSGLIRLPCRRAQAVNPIPAAASAGFGRRRTTNHRPCPTIRPDRPGTHLAWIVNDRLPCAQASTNHPAPAPSGSGGHPPTGPGTSRVARLPLEPVPGLSPHTLKHCASGFLGNDDPHGHIEHQARAAEHRQQHEEHSDKGRIEVEVLGQATTHPGHLTVGLTAVQLAGPVHRTALLERPSSKGDD